MTDARLGAYDFINCAPVYAGIHLDEVRLPIGVDLVESVPAVLNNSALFGEVDVTPVSASHYIGREDQFEPVPNLAIVSDGPVQSVLFVHDGPIEKLDGKTVGITQKSSTARTMLQILMEKHWKIRPKVNIGPCYAQDVGDRYDAALIIGDDALSIHADPPEDLGVVDIGQAWRKFTGGPAIWAVWVARRDFKDKNPEVYGKVEDVLQEARSWGRANPDRVVEYIVERTDFDREIVERYFEGLGYELDAPAEKALETLQTYKSELT